MSISSFRRRYPSLIRRAEKDMKLKFKKKPRLVLFKRTPNDTACGKLWYNCEGKNLEIVKAEVCLSKRMIRDYEPLAEVAASHELRENLLMQHGRSGTESHRLAQRHEKRDTKRLGLKTTGWEIRKYYHRKIHRKTPEEKFEERTLGRLHFSFPTFRMCMKLARSSQREWFDVLSEGTVSVAEKKLGEVIRNN